MDVEKFLQDLRGLLANSEREPLTVSVEEAARRLSVSASTVRRLVRGHRLLTVRIGGRVMVPVSELKRLATPVARQPRPEAPQKGRGRTMAERIRRG